MVVQEPGSLSIIALHTITALQIRVRVFSSLFLILANALIPKEASRPKVRKKGAMGTGVEYVDLLITPAYNKIQIRRFRSQIII